MGVKSYKKVNSEDEILNRIQDYIGQALNPLLSAFIVDGVHLSAVELASGSNVVAHKLGRVPKGYLIVGKSANIDVWGREHTKSNLNLESSGSLVLDMWVY